MELRTLPDGENRALNHDQSASKLRRRHPCCRRCNLNYGVETARRRTGIPPPPPQDEQSGKPFLTFSLIAVLFCSPRQQSRRHPPRGAKPGQPATRLTNHPLGTRARIPDSIFLAMKNVSSSHPPCLLQGWTKRLQPGLVNLRRKIAFSCLLQPGERNFSSSNSSNLAEAF